MQSSQHPKKEMQCISLPMHADKSLFSWIYDAQSVPYLMPNPLDELVAKTCQNVVPEISISKAQIVDCDKVPLEDYCQCLITQNGQQNHNSHLADGLDKFNSYSQLALDKYDFSNTINELWDDLALINSLTDIVLKHGKKCSSNSKKRRLSKSRYIGVTRKRKSWQALIWIGKTKVYIGSYKNEMDAALAFDFFSIIQHGLRATTNFDYDKLTIMNMVNFYFKNGKKFDPVDYRMRPTS